MIVQIMERFRNPNFGEMTIKCDEMGGWVVTITVFEDGKIQPPIEVYSSNLIDALNVGTISAGL